MRRSEDVAAWRVAMDRLVAENDTERLWATDPVWFLHQTADPAQQELLAFLASCLAFGGVAQIKGSIARVLGAAGESLLWDRPEPGRLLPALAGFKHRWADGQDVTVLLNGLLAVRARGGLEAAFLEGVRPGDEDYLEALTAFRNLLLRLGREGHPVGTLRPGAGDCLLPDLAKGGACKRLHLALRWLVRKDQVDLGLWRGLDKARLLMPVDVHVHRICTRLGFCKRSAADLKASREITANFRLLDPTDPVKYDFAITRLGMLGFCGAKPGCDRCPLQGLCGGEPT